MSSFGNAKDLMRTFSFISEEHEDIDDYEDLCIEPW